MPWCCPAPGRSDSRGLSGAVGWPGPWASAWWLEQWSSMLVLNKEFPCSVQSKLIESCGQPSLCALHKQSGWGRHTFVPSMAEPMTGCQSNLSNEVRAFDWSAWSYLMSASYLRVDSNDFCNRLLICLTLLKYLAILTWEPIGICSVLDSAPSG